MKYGFFNYITHALFTKKTTCILSDDNDGLNIGLRVVKKRGMEAEPFQDYKKFLFNLHSHSTSPYNVALIFKNGSTVHAESVSKFIKQYNSSIKTIIFTDEKDLDFKLQFNST